MELGNGDVSVCEVGAEDGVEAPREDVVTAESSDRDALGGGVGMDGMESVAIDTDVVERVVADVVDVETDDVEGGVEVGDGGLKSIGVNYGAGGETSDAG